MPDLIRPAVPTADAERSRVRQGILAILLAVFTFQVMAIIAKWLATRGYPPTEIVFFRSGIALVPVLALVQRSGGLGMLVTPRPMAQVGRGLLGCIAIGGFFFSISMMPLADATAIGFTAPLFITALSVPLLGERVGIHRWSAVLVGFAGVLIMLRPGGEGVSDGVMLGALLALGGSAGYAVAMIATRQLSRTEPNGAIVFYNTAVITAVFGAVLPFQWVTPSWEDLGLIIAMGTCGGLAQWWQTKAFALAPAAIISPFNYTALVWSTSFGFLLWGDLPSAGVMAGAALVVASGLYILHRETRRRR